MIYARRNLLRPRGGHDHARVTNVELFFDLVFVFAVTQLSHNLLAHLSLLGAIETGLLMMAVWWVWIYTSWITNWLDPDKRPVRLMLFVLMAAGLVMSSSIPQAFGSRGLAFAATFAFMQVGRCLFMLWAVGNHDPVNLRNFRRIIVWLSVSAVFWLAGGFSDGWQRIVLWALAIGIEYVSPAVGMWVPGLGGSKPQDWKIDGPHLAERCALFVIIALGESLLVTGATFADMEWHATTLTAFVTAFLGSVAMWAVYFNVGAERGSHRIAQSSDPGRLGRSGYTYLHILIVAGVIVSAVADELVLAHPHGHDGHTELKTMLIVVGGPAIYLLGTGWFKTLTAPTYPLSHLVGLGLLVLLGCGYGYATPLHLAMGTTAIMIAGAVWEWASLTDRSRRPRAHVH
jgi:low temperature requirement protein LtrA